MVAVHHRRRSALRTDHGAAAVEFALVMIPLLLVVFGIINFGLIFASQISLNSAARDAARAGVVQPLGGTGITCSAIATAARSAGGTIGSPTGNVGVVVAGPGGTCSLPAGTGTVTGQGGSHPCTGATGASPQLQVTLTVDYTSPVPLVPPSSTTLTSVGRFQCEYN